MVFRGSVSGTRDVGEDVEIAVVNVRWKGAATWRNYNSEIKFMVPLSKARAFWAGRAVRIEVVPK